MVNTSLKEGLVAIKLILDDDEVRVIEKQIHCRMTIGHLKLMIRRLFRLPAKTCFELVARTGKHSQTINQEMILDADSREVGFYDLENGDIVCARIQSG